jgi:multidrug resistance efflux pump
MKGKLKYLITGIIILIAVIVVALKYWDYITNPWTRDGQVRAQVIQITPRVSGPIIKLPIKDNQLVKAGDLLFKIDPRTFEADLEQARAEVDDTRDNLDALAKQVEAEQANVAAAGATVEQAEAAIKGYAGRVVETKKEYDRQKTLDKKGATSKRAVETARANWVSYVSQKANADATLLQMRASLSQAKADLAKAKANLGAPGDKNAQLRQAKAKVRSAELNLEFTQKKAPVDGYVTNLNLRLGSQAVENQAILALVDVNSYWVVGFFKENYIEGMRTGDRAVLTLMSYRDKPIEGSVDSLGWGIAQDDGSTSFDMLPTISATFEWIRLAQRVPVRIHIDLDKLPEEVKLRVGTTVSVLVMTGTSDSDSKMAAVAAPRALQ